MMWHEGGIIKKKNVFPTIELKIHLKKHTFCVCVCEGDAIGLCIDLLFVYRYYFYVVLLA